MFGVLDGLFSPRSIAVVGASRDRSAVGRRILDALIEAPFEGPVYAVNPAADHLGAIPSFARLGDIGRPIDLVVVAVPAKYVLDVIRDAIDVGASFGVVVSAGFAEIGDAGAQQQRELVDLAREHGLRLVGPNCLGVLSTDPDVRMNASFAPSLPPSGAVGLCSQSGALGIAVIELADRLGLGLSSFVSIGNQADLTVTDIVDHWGQDERISAGLLYLESIDDPIRFRTVASRVSPSVPLVAVKAGRTSEGRRAANSHTAALAGSDRAVDALLHQSGVIRAASLPDMFGIARILVSQPLPRGRRAAIVTNSGGPGVLCVDALRDAGFEVPELSESARAELAALLPEAASVTNPVDMLAAAGPETYGQVVETVVALDEIDLVIVIYTPIGIASDAAVRRATESAVWRARRDGATAAVLLSVVGGGAVDGDAPPAAAEDVARQPPETIPTFDFPEDLARLMGPIADRCNWLDGDRGSIFELDEGQVDAVRRIISAALDERNDGWLTVAEARAVLSAIGVPVSRGAVVTSAGGAEATASEIGFPVALSIAATEIVHKSDTGGVHLGLESPEEVVGAYEQIVSMATGQGVAPDGVLVAAMASGVELFVGVQSDARFGPLIGVGSGGTEVEILDDVAFRLAPLTDRDAREMLCETRSWQLLQRHRGSPQADVAAVLDVLRRVAAVATADSRIQELDINPLFAGPDGVIAADVRILVAGS
ncbi:MAG: acetate--CoA ligase family protein [Acidimicrobiales bacterium]